MNIFLRLKHWQLFGLQTAIPFIFYVISKTTVIPSQYLKTVLAVFLLLMILSISASFGWIYTLGVNLNKKLPDTVKLNLTKFKWFFFIPFVYMIFYVVFMFYFIFGMNFFRFAIIFSFQLFAIFCIFYCIYFNAKSLKAVELQRPVTFSDYASEFLLIWMLPVGIWILQPKINKMFDETLRVKE